MARPVGPQPGEHGVVQLVTKLSGNGITRLIMMRHRATGLQRSPLAAAIAQMIRVFGSPSNAEPGQPMGDASKKNIKMHQQKNRKEGRKEGRREGGKEGRQGGREGGREEGRKGGREEGRKEGRKDGGREGSKEGRKNEGRYIYIYMHCS